MAGLIAPGARAEEAREPTPRKMSLSISGGVSLGGYESGAVWIWLRYLRERTEGDIGDALGGRRRATLAGITGASAGGINTLVSALIWCSDEGRIAAAKAADDAAPAAWLGTVDDNLLARAWAPVGFDTLLPPEAGADAFFPLDGLLSRRAFGPSVAMLQAAFDAPAYRPGCRIPFAVTVTRGRPWQERVAGLTVSNQRFALPLALTVDASGRPWFVNNTDVLRNEAQLGQYLFLAERPGVDEQRLRGRSGGEPPPWVVPADVVLQAVLASSAFPLAFSPVVLPQCIPADRCPPEAPTPPLSGFGWLGCGDREQCGDFSRLSCAGLTTAPRPLALCASRFVDGGFFDNVPLGPAMAQAELDLAREEVAAGVEYLYFDPDVRRLAQQTRPTTPDDGDRGLSRVLQVLGDAVGTARAYELYSTLRFETFNSGPGPIVGGFARLLDELRKLVHGGTWLTEPGPLDRCLEAVEAQYAAAPSPESCPPLPGACAPGALGVSVDDAAASADGSADVASGAAASADVAAEVASGETASAGASTDAAAGAGPEACLPPTLGTLTAGLDRLSRRLLCRAASDDFTAAEAAAQRVVTAAVVRRVARIDACLDRHPPARNARLDAARLDRDLADARRFLADAALSAAPVRRLVLPTRFPPLAAGQLRNFGAFFDLPLRRYDYWAGVHDGLQNLALWRCGDRLAARALPPEPGALAACADAEYDTLRAALVPGVSPIGARILDELSLQERIVAARSADPPRPGPCGADGRGCAPAPRCDFAEATDQGACLAHAALTRCEGTEKAVFERGGATFCPGDFAIAGFVDALRAVGYRAQSAYMRLLLGAEGATGPLLEVIARLEGIERDEAARAGARAASDREGRAVHRAGAADAARNAFLFAGGGVAVRRVERVHDAFELDPSTIPDDGFSAASLLPYRLGVDALHGGFALGWEPRIGGGGAVEGRLIVDAVRWRDDGGGWRSAVNPAIALRWWDSTLVGAFGLGAIVERPWHTSGWELGAGAHLDLIADSVRLGVGRLLRRVPDAADGSTATSVGWMVDVWLLDLPGLIWLLGQ
ncbi:MAG: patatin-like phospholipase family protein [bacterium]